ncbi:MAG: TRAP transporter small permease [Silicimonas sp.]|nr:TRAP transporter small permease [Silicimonas sp.]NND17852.1 TRAP transporter small permease [Silicimonas sp.]RZW02265.1 MAG: TRAP transporter small permease [Paracoccaceae bacterium]
MDESHGSAVEWLVPLAFSLTFAWVVWQGPGFILTFGPQNDQLAAQFARTDIAKGFDGMFGGPADIIDWGALFLSPILFAIGVATVRRAPMEFESWRPADRVAVFIGRITMMLIVLLCAVMLYEVFVRYVLEDGTYWANELTLWLAGFTFLCAGLYAMQQRSHIRIFLLYDICPRWLQRTFDTISTALIVLFAFFLIYGGYGEAFAKFMRWELFGTAFDPPIPATIKVTVLIVIALVALQAVVNLISDWNAEPVIHTAADDIDEQELEALRRAVGAEGVGDQDVTRGSIQGKDVR